MTIENLIRNINRNARQDKFTSHVRKARHNWVPPSTPRYHSAVMFEDFKMPSNASKQVWAVMERKISTDFWIRINGNKGFKEGFQLRRKLNKITKKCHKKKPLT